MDENNSSVYSLIGDLCKVVFSENNRLETVPLKIISNCRKKNFQIILQKAKTSLSNEYIEKQLNFHQFNLQVNGENQKAQEFETCLKTIDNNKDNEYVEPMVEFLLQLKNTSTNAKNTDIKEPFLGCVPQTHCTESPKPYPTFTGDMFELPLTFQHAFDSKCSQNPYMLNFEHVDRSSKNGQIFTNALNEMILNDVETSPKRGVTFFSDSNMLLGFESDNFHLNHKVCVYRVSLFFIS
jgi:hypothetical protein